MNTLEQRIERLERSARRWRALATVLLAAIAVAILLGAVAASQPATSEVIRAKKIEVVNKAGKPVIVLGSRNEEGILKVNNDRGEGACAIGSVKSGGYIQVWKNGVNEDSVAVVDAHVDQAGHGVLNLRGPDGAKSPGVSLFAADQPGIDIVNPDAAGAVALRSLRSGGLIQITNHKKKVVVQLTPDETGADNILPGGRAGKPAVPARQPAERAQRDAGKGFSYKNVSMRGDGDSVECIGEISNDSGEVEELSVFTLSAYGEDGALLDVGKIIMTKLEQGQSKSFSVNLLKSRAEDIKSYTIKAD